MITFGTIMAPRNHPDRPRPLPEIYQEYISDALQRQPDGSLPDPAVAEVTREMIRRGDMGGSGPPIVGTPDEVYALLAPLIATPGVTTTTRCSDLRSRRELSR